MGAFTISLGLPNPLVTPMLQVKYGCVRNVKISQRDCVSNVLSDLCKGIYCLPTIRDGGEATAHVIAESEDMFEVSEQPRPCDGRLCVEHKRLLPQVHTFTTAQDIDDIPFRHTVAHITVRKRGMTHCKMSHGSVLIFSQPADPVGVCSVPLLSLPNFSRLDGVQVHTTGGEGDTRITALTLNTSMDGKPQFAG